jgi:hypothetical protein
MYRQGGLLSDGEQTARRAVVLKPSSSSYPRDPAVRDAGAE